jgi:hypothetical protein
LCLGWVLGGVEQSYVRRSQFRPELLSGQPEHLASTGLVLDNKIRCNIELESLFSSHVNSPPLIEYQQMARSHTEFLPHDTALHRTIIRRSTECKSIATHHDRFEVWSAAERETRTRAQQDGGVWKPEAKRMDLSSCRRAISWCLIVA